MWASWAFHRNQDSAQISGEEQRVRRGITLRRKCSECIPVVPLQCEQGWFGIAINIGGNGVSLRIEIPALQGLQMVVQRSLVGVCIGLFCDGPYEGGIHIVSDVPATCFSAILLQRSFIQVFHVLQAELEATGGEGAKKNEKENKKEKRNEWEWTGEHEEFQV